MKKISLILVFFLIAITAWAQEDRVKVFRDTRIVNGQSTELIPKGTMKFIISHRFGVVNNGIQDFFGLDNSTIRIGLDYALTDNINIGIGRNSLQVHYDGYFKYRILQQKKNGSMPLSLAYYTNIAVKALVAPETADLTFANKVSYTHQILISRRFNDYLSVQISPTYIHRNFVNDAASKNDVFSVGTAARFQLSKVIALNLEYYYLPPDQVMPNVQSSVGLGVEFETKGHIFQLNFTNSEGLIAPLYIAETEGVVGNGDIHFGFNITRDFKVGARR
ncbi:MAG: hypothetical protein ACJAT1_000821 [Marivirga sp.]|jgi:hypothetical protein